MGLYINPLDESKESFLSREGEYIPSPSWPPTEGKVYVCLVDNLHWSAAGVAYSEHEFKAFSQPDDFRPKMWFSIPKALLPGVTGDDLKDYFPEFRKS